MPKINSRRIYGLQIPAPIFFCNKTLCLYGLVLFDNYNNYFKTEVGGNFFKILLDKLRLFEIASNFFEHNVLFTMAAQTNFVRLVYVLYYKISGTFEVSAPIVYVKFQIYLKYFINIPWLMQVSGKIICGMPTSGIPFCANSY